MSPLCTHSYKILRIGEGFWWREILKVNFKKNAHTDMELQMLLFIFFHEVLKKKKKSSAAGRSFTKQGARRFPEARRLACLPAARPAERGWRHSTKGCQC